MRQPFTLGIHVLDYNCEPSAVFFFIIYKNMSVYVRIKIKRIFSIYSPNIDVFIIKIFYMHVKPVCKFLCLKVEETSKTIELIAILAPPKKPA